MKRPASTPLLTFASIAVLAVPGAAQDRPSDPACVQDREVLLTPSATSRGDTTDLAGCIAGNARDNTTYPLEMGADYVPLTTDDALGFYVVYSPRTLNGTTANNNVGLFLMELDGGEILLYGAGYGNYSAALFDAARDAANVDSVLRGCLGKDPNSTPIRFVSPHWHGDHINVEFIHTLESMGWSIVEILYHVNDDYYIRSYYNWRPEDEAKFTIIPDGACNEEILSFPSPLGKIWFVSRKGHAPGAIDLVIDVRNNPLDRFEILGSQPGGSCPDPPQGTRGLITAHGNVILKTVAQIVPYGCGVNPAESLLAITGRPKLGTEVVLGVGDPSGAVAAGAVPYLWTSFAPDPRIPCGEPLHLPGMARPGEVLISTRMGDLLGPPLMGTAWAGPGHPYHFAVAIPSEANLAGLSVYLQGGLIDPLAGVGQRIMLTTAFEFRIGP